jgi:gliding motility-associated-like protein
MKKVLITLLFLVSLLSNKVFAQGNSCGTASPFCTATGAATFPASQNTTAPSGPNYGCLFSQPNPAWFYLQIANAGPLTLNMTNSANVDIDFIIWGPFTSASTACSSGLTGTAVACSYSGSSNETGVIPSAVVGEVYVLMVTNYSNQPTTISVAQTGGTGATNCSIVCSMTSISANLGQCNSPANTFSLSGTLKYMAPPTTGTLTISNSCSAVTQVFNAPFAADSIDYILNGLPANGSSCTVTAVFSSDPTCTITQNFITPPPCFVSCPFNVDSARTCDGVPAALIASGATHYIWSTGDTTASILASGVPANYTVIGITGTCADTMITHVTTFPPPTVSFSADTINGCDKFTSHFNADTIGNFGATYAWNFGEQGATGTGAQTLNLYAEPGCHTVTLTASFGPGCSTTDSISCMINVFPLPYVNFNVAPEGIDAIASTAYFTNTSVNAALWLWSFGDSSTTSTILNPEHTYADVGTYPVTLYATSADGCIDSATTFVKVSDIITKYIPTAFSPNKNNINDVWNIYTYGILPDEFEMLIFDRWGKQIHKTNDLYEGWNGAVNNKGFVVEPDVYVYHINYKEVTGKRRIITGLVTLLR